MPQGALPRAAEPVERDSDDIPGRESTDRALNDRERVASTG